MKGRRLHTPVGSRMVPAGSAYHEGQGGRGWRRIPGACPSTFPLVVPMRSCQRGSVSPWGQCRATAGLCVQSSAQGWADTRGQISTPTAPAPAVAAMGWSPVPAHSEGAQESQAWGQVGTEQLCPKPGLTASGRGAGGSRYTSPVPCLQGWEMWIPREALLPWQHQPHDTALCEVSGSAHSGHTEQAAQAALPCSESQHSHQVAHKIFSFFFIEITIKN